jgi:hypothetical protein
MPIKLPEPPEWWLKYKPLRWLLAALVLYWIFGTLLPRFRAESPPPAASPVEVPDTAAEPEAPYPKAAYTQVEAQRVRMMDVLRSYDSVATVQALLAQRGYTAELSTIKRKPPSYRYPPYRNDTLAVSKYKHEAYEGRLTLEFFNDRLYQAYFVPAQPAEYLRWLRSRGFELPIKRTGRSSLTQGHLRITTNIDFASSEVGRTVRSTPFVMWEDLRLVQQMQAWGPVS